MRNLSTTPDGRIIAFDDPQSPPSTPPVGMSVLAPFIDACTATLPDPPLAGQARTGLFLFLLGAADRLWQRLDLADDGFPAVAAALLRRQGVAAGEAQTLAYSLGSTRLAGGLARDTLVDGAETLDAWLEGHDGNSVLRLGETLRRWERERGT